MVSTGGQGARPPRPRSRRPSTGWCTTPAGPTSWPPCSAAPTRCPGRTSPTPRPSRPGWSGSSRRRGSPLLGLVSVIAPVIASGNACVVVAAEADPCVAIAFAEVLATSDVPGGVINILTGKAAELGAAPGRARRRQRAGPDRRRRRAADRARAGRGRDGEAGLRAERHARLHRRAGHWPGCGPSWRSRPSGIPTGALSLSGGTSY